jgi:hypothetical protein
MDTRSIWQFALCGSLPLISSTGGGESVNHASEIARIKDECAELRERLGKQIEERAIEIAKHQRALLQEECASKGQAEDP